MSVSANTKISKKWLEMAKIYKYFARGHGSNLDFSEEAKLKMYLYESKGVGDESLDIFNINPNGYAVGKHWLNVMVAMWRIDIANGFLLEKELYDNKNFPHWWLDSVLKGIWRRRESNG